MFQSLIQLGNVGNVQKSYKAKIIRQRTGPLQLLPAICEFLPGSWLPGFGTWLSLGPYHSLSFHFQTGFDHHGFLGTSSWFSMVFPFIMNHESSFYRNEWT